MSPRWSGIDSAVGAALLDELSESPLPGARYAREVVRRRLPDVLTEARAAAVAPVLEALREKVEALEYLRLSDQPGGPPSATERLINRSRVLRLLSAPPLRPSGEPEPGGLDVERLARQFHDMLMLYHHNHIGCGWQFASVVDGEPLCPCPAIAAEYARLTPERPAGEAGT